MSAMMDREKARKGFQHFVTSHLAAEAGHTGFTTADKPVRESVTLSRSQIADAFIELHPEHKDYRKDIDSVLAEYDKFGLSKDEWQKIISQLDAKKPR